MTETMNSETIWYLKEMVARSEKDFVEGRTYSHDAVKEMLKARRHEDKMVTACV